MRTLMSDICQLVLSCVLVFQSLAAVRASIYDYFCNTHGIAIKQLDEIKLILSSPAETAEIKIALIGDIVLLSEDLRVEENDTTLNSKADGIEFLEQSSNFNTSASDEENDNLWISVIVSIILTFCASLASGLTMGLVSIDPLEMAIKLRSGSEEETRQAKQLLPLVTRHHFLLVSLLLFNSLSFEALPIFLDNIVPPAAAVVLSVTLILFVGEILPSAIFTGPNQLKISSFLSPIVWLIMIVFSPIAWPIGRFLDAFLGVEEFKRYNRAEISALVEVQHDMFTAKIEADMEMGSEKSEEPLHEDEVSIVLGVLGVGLKKVSDAMIDIEKVFSLSIDDVLDANCMANIMASGHSRIPIHEGDNRRNIRGYLQVKKLIIISPDDSRRIRSLTLRTPEIVSPTASLLELLNTFQLGRAHIALVSHDPDGYREALRNDLPLEGLSLPTGIICLEDILEEILQEEIFDESDVQRLAVENRAKDIIAKFARNKRVKNLTLSPAVSAIHPMRRNSGNTRAVQLRKAAAVITEKSPLLSK